MELKELVKQAYYSEKGGMLLMGDCIEWMKEIPDQSIDMILADLPYGTTACKWDVVIPFDLLWEQYERIIKDSGAIVLTASQPFTSLLIISNLKLFRYEWIWEKTLFSNFALVKKQPAKQHENVCVFYKKQPVYNPQMQIGKPYKDKERGRTMSVIGDAIAIKKPIENNGTRYPSSVQKFSNGNNGSIHPTQKPVALFEYLLKTYTKENEIVLDNVAGSCTTAIACKNTNRRWICIEKEQKYCDISIERIKNHKIN